MAQGACDDVTHKQNNAAEKHTFLSGACLYETFPIVLTLIGFLSSLHSGLFPTGGLYSFARSCDMKRLYSACVMSTFPEQRRCGYFCL